MMTRSTRAVSGGRDNGKNTNCSSATGTSERRDPYNAIANKKVNNNNPNSKNNTKSSVRHGTYVWVRIDLVAELVNNGHIPRDWKPRKRARARPSQQQRYDHNNKSVNSRNVDEDDGWGWCRAYVTSSVSSASADASFSSPPPKQQSSNNNNESTAAQGGEDVVGSPFKVKLRKVQTTPARDGSGAKIKNPLASISSPWTAATTSPDRQQQDVPEEMSVTLTIDDEEYAPYDLQHQTVSFTYKTGEHTKLCTANTWWQSAEQQDHQTDDDDRRRPPDDLTGLEQLHEPAVVFCLQNRYENDAIYTYTGKILLALNPFQSLEHIYGEDVMQQYWEEPSTDETHNQKPRNSSQGGGKPQQQQRSSGTGTEQDEVEPLEDHRRPPHIYAIAEDAYRSMIRSLQQTPLSSNTQKGSTRNGSVQGPPSGAGGSANQSILVSGESGAGKTVTTKIVMRYLATLSQRSDQQHVEAPVDGIDSAGKRSSAASNSWNESFSRRRSIASKSTADGKRGVSIESQVLQSNPILESFGNARTIRNDNSSRFGKFIEIHFADSGCLISASIKTYLLEKVRLISQSPGERNYHVFYETLTGLSQMEKRQLMIQNSTPQDFYMTSTSGTYDRRDGITDSRTYSELRNALDTVGFSKEHQLELFSVVAALLHTSNLTFCPATRGSSSSIGGATASVDNDACQLDTSNPSLRAAVSLLGVETAVLDEALCRCAIQAPRGEVLHKNLSSAQAQKAVEALIKTTYDALFTHIVTQINGLIAARQEQQQQQQPRESSSPMKLTKHDKSLKSGSTASIGVLDIFGFESFVTNSFEQLCINYCNETLQQQFNRFVFKLEQQEYKKEGIDWSFISFPDNQDILDLIDKRHDGILSVLDEQCRLPRCTDTTFALAVYDKCSGHDRFEATKAQKADRSFAIHHYAGLVEYDTTNFLEKNKDELPKETTELLMSSSISFLSRLGRELSDSVSKSMLQPQCNPSSRGSLNGSRNKQLQRSSSSILRDSVGTQFCTQLRALRTKIESTAPHYVRCLKPNDDLVPNHFQPLVIADQLRCAGVLEAIRVSRVGFPHRYIHERFVQRYCFLCRSELTKYGSGYKTSDLCDVLVEALIPLLLQIMGTDQLVAVGRGQQKREIFLGMQMGRTKVFLRKRAFEALEYLRNRKLADSATRIQALARMALARSSYFISIYAIIVIQTFFRQIGAHRCYTARKKENAAKKIQRARRCSQARRYRSKALAVWTMQRAWRCYSARRILRAAMLIAWWSQATYRGVAARQYCAYIFLDKNASTIQRAWWIYESSRTFRRARRSTICLQNLHRSRVARRELFKLRREARDLPSISAERDRYREELVRLRQELEERRKEPPAAPPPEAVQTMAEKEEVQQLRSEVQRLQSELEKAHRLATPTSSVHSNHAQDPDVKFLVHQLAKREEQLESMRQELVILRSRDEGSSYRSVSIDGSAVFRSHVNSAGIAGLVPFVSKGPSPVRSDVSLLDAAGDDTTQYFRKLAIDVGMTPNGPPMNDEELLRLHASIRQNDFQIFDQVMEHSSEICLLVNKSDKHGRTSLHLASVSQNTEMAEALIERGAVVNAQDGDGETPLHLAEEASMTELLLTQGNANPNIPNVAGICALHLAVQRRDITSVRLLLLKNANVNNADNVRWFTPLHLISLSARSEVDERPEDDLRCRIAQLLTATYGGQSDAPDMNYQDKEGNVPLHYATQLETDDACDLIRIFLDKDADPNILNERNQSPLHLLAHNERARNHGVFHEMMYSMLSHGADPNMQSLTGCTPLHLCLYHKDIESAILLVSHGAELHHLWKKPKRWTSFWNDMGSSAVLALDMVDDDGLYQILSAINRPQRLLAPTRSWCMHCRLPLNTSKRAKHCKRCSRLVCGLKCSRTCLPVEYFPMNFKVTEPSWVCVTCERILTTRATTTTTSSLSLSSSTSTSRLSSSFVGASFSMPSLSFSSSPQPSSTSTSEYTGATRQQQQQILVASKQQQHHPYHRHNSQQQQQHEIMTNGTYPTTATLSSYGGDDDDDRFSC